MDADFSGVVELTEWWNGRRFQWRGVAEWTPISVASNSNKCLSRTQQEVIRMKGMAMEV